MKDAQRMTTLLECGCGQPGIDLGPSHCAETFMDKKQPH